jgi:hypothetical protein
MIGISMEQFDTISRIAVLENEVKNIATDVKEMRQEQKAQHELLMEKFNKMDERLGVIERWRWMILGAATVVGYLLAHISTK